MRDLIKVIVSKLIEMWIWLPMTLCRTRKKSFLKGYEDFFLRQVLKSYEKTTKYYFFYDIVPKRSEDFVDVNIPTCICKYAVIIQGPVMLKDHFTLETVRLYKKIFSQGIIIVSTWIDENSEELEKIKKEGAIVIQSQLPEKCGIANVNYQFKSSYEGMKKAKEFGAKFAFKTRSDQRVYRNHLFEELYLLLKQNPCEASLQNERIVTLGGRSGNMFWPVHQCDFFMFGEINDMCAFFNQKYDEDTDRDAYRKREPQKVTRLYKSIHGTHAEPYIFKRYLENLGIVMDFSVKQHWRIISDLFITLSENDLNLYWLDKYESRYSGYLRNGVYRPEDKEYKALCYNFDYFKWNIIKNNYFNYNEKLEVYKTMECGDGVILTNENNETLFRERARKD